MDLELDQFRDVDLVIDRANDSFIQRQFVSQGDYKGRSLTVQVTNNGSVGEVSGLTLNLNWHNKASGLSDLSAFTVIDKTTSVFRIEYPEHMMTPGEVVATIQVLQNGKSTFLKSFTLTVQQLAGQAVGIVQKAEFSALVAVLGDANRFRTDIDGLNMNKANKNDLAKTDMNLEKLMDTKADKESLTLAVDDLTNKLSNIPKGNPSGTYPTLSALKAAYPDGNNNIYVVTADGKWYYWEGSSWIPGGTYNSTALGVGQVTTIRLGDLIRGKNLFNKDSVTSGYIDRATGKVIPESANSASDYIVVSNISKLVWSMKNFSNVNIAFYGDEGVFLSSNQILAANPVKYVDVPVAASLMRFSIDKSQIDTCQVESGITPTEYESFYQYNPNIKKPGEDEPVIIEKAQQLENKIVTTEKLGNLISGKNLFNKATSVVGYINRADGNVITDSANKASDFINVEEAFSYTISPKITNGAINVCKYDKNKKLMSSQQFLPNSEKQIVTVDNGEVYVRFSINNLYVEKAQFEQGLVASEFEPYYKYNPDLVMPSVIDRNDNENKILVSKKEEGNRSIKIYCPAGEPGKFFNYEMNYEQIPFTDGGTYQNSDLWRIVGGRMVELDIETGEILKAEEIVNAGAWECAIEIDGLPDFHGTYHGYEKMDSIDIYLNNVKTDINGIFNIWADNYKVIYRAKLIKQGTEAEYIAEVLRVYEWNQNGLKLTQRYKWLESFSKIKNAYLTMLPIYRRTNYQDPNSKLITDTAYTDYDFIEYDISRTDFQAGINAQREGIKQCVIYGSDSKISADVIVMYKNEQVKNMFNISNAEQYNKLYYSYCTGQGVNINDSWESVSNFQFKVNTR